jgi:hypothetical protein
MGIQQQPHQQQITQPTQQDLEVLSFSFFRPFKKL